MFSSAIAQDKLPSPLYTLINMLSPSLLLFVFLAVVIPDIVTGTPAPTIVNPPFLAHKSRRWKRQGDRQVLQTIAPNYLVLLNQSQPDTIYGSQYTGDVSWTPGENNEWTTIVGWDIPVVEGATECYIRFILPPITSPFAWIVEGAGFLNFYYTSRPVNPATDSWNNRPTRLGRKGSALVPSGSDGGEAIISGASLDYTAIAGKRLDFEFVAAHQGNVRNRVETFQLGISGNQGWFIEFAIGAN